MSRKKKRSPADDLVNSLIAETQSLDASDNENTVDATINLERHRENSDKTEAIPMIPTSVSQVHSAETVRLSSPQKENETVFGRITPKKEVRTGGAGSAAEASLTQSENLRVAQERILDLERELNRLRTENEQLLAAGETLRRRGDELVSRAEKAEADLQEEIQTGNGERKLLQESISAKERENALLRQKIEELELRLESDLKKIRVRERELENRLELTKMEEAALLRNKDDIILDLKRRIDQLTTETDNYRNRGLELHKQIEAHQERFRRTVRALRLALTMLEETQGDVVPIKKAE